MSVRKGFTLLEAMVALVILAIVSLAYLELFGGAVRATESASHWSRAVEYAEDGMELVKLEPREALNRGAEALPGGFERRSIAEPWGQGLQHVTVLVTLPGGGQLALSRLVEAQ